MAINEQVNITVSQKGIEQVDKQITSLGKSSLTASQAIKGIAIALGAVVAVRGLATLASDAIKTSAAFESYGVTLRALLGSQQEANTALEHFTSLASKTPFAVGEIVQGATTLAAAALGNRQKLEELTQTAANLAAVTGLSFQEAASNLARSLSAGIGAADLFRERGVKALIESIQGIPDATKLSTAQLSAAFQATFGELGTFGDAAKNLSLTLGGALSNIDDSAQQFKASLGAALSPVVINAANALFIPFFQNLQALVAANAKNIAAFAAGALSGLVRAFTLAGETGLFFAGKLADVRQFIVTLTGSLFDAQLRIAEFDLALNKLANSIGLVSDADLAFQQNEVNALAAGVDAIAEDVGNAGRETEKFKAGLDALSESLSKLNDLASTTNLTEAIVTPNGGPTAAELTQNANKAVDNGPTKEQLKLLQEQQSAREALLGIIRDQRLEEAQGRSELEGQLFLIDEQIGKVTELAQKSGEQALGEQAINDLIAQRKALQEGGGFADGLTGGLAESLKAGFQTANKDGKDFAKTFSEALQTSANDALFKSFDESFGVLQKGLKEAFQAVGDALPDTFKDSFGKLGPALGNALGQVAQFVALQGLSALLGGGGNSQSSSHGSVTSAVTSTQAVRGIVAGPQEIAIANVGRNLEEANQPVVAELKVQTGVLRTIANLLQASGAGGFDSDTMALATGSAPAAAI